MKNKVKVWDFHVNEMVDIPKGTVVVMITWPSPWWIESKCSVLGRVFLGEGGMRGTCPSNGTRAVPRARTHPLCNTLFLARVTCPDLSDRFISHHIAEATLRVREKCIPCSYIVLENCLTNRKDTSRCQYLYENNYENTTISIAEWNMIIS